MLEQTSSQPNSRFMLHSLRKYSRETDVETQIQQYLDCPALLFQHARRRDAQGIHTIREEVLVALSRVWLRAERRDLAGQALDLLQQRLAAKASWMVDRRSLKGWHREECLKLILDQILDDLMSQEQGEEFWEVRFWVCLERRINSMASAYRSKADRFVAQDPLIDGEGHETDRIEMVPTSDLFSPEMRALLKDALGRLSEQERSVLMMVKSEGMTHQEVAEQFGVTDRTIRNWLTSAERKLLKWRDEPYH